jgi:FdhD protein
MGKGVIPARWYEYRHDWAEVSATIIEEALITIYLNGFELVTIMATPKDQRYLALGFLKNEGLIEEAKEIETIYLTPDGCCVDVWLNHPVSRPKRAIITSGCGGGVTFADPTMEIKPLEDGFTVDPEELFLRFQEMHKPGSLHAEARGVHTAGLTDGSTILALAEDVGRHNTIDKLLGQCLEQEIDTKGKILLATGRVSSEMLRKGATMGCPVIASRNSPTSMSLELAQSWNITLIGYVRRSTLRVYAHPERLKYIPQNNIQ